MPRLWILIIVAGARLLAQPNVAAWEVLKKDLAHTDPDKRKQAVLAVGTIGPAPEVITILNEALRDKHLRVRQATAALLGELKYPQNIPALKAALDDDPEVAVQAAKTLWAMGDPGGKEVLERLYTGEESGGPGMIEGALRDAKDKLTHPKKLITLGVNEASGALLGPFSMGIIAAEGALKDSGAPGRALAADLLSRECDARVVQLLNWSLDNDKSKFVKAATAKALGKCGNLATIDRLMLLVADPNDGVRDMAAASIVRLTINLAPKSTAVNRDRDAAAQ